MCVKYSVCITNYNTIHSVKQSLESLLSQVDERFEIIVVDNESNDGSLDILREYEKMGKIKLITKPCSRGVGRQIGVRNSKGKYIISQLDMDDVFEPKLFEILEIYHTHFEGYLLLVQGIPGMMIAPRELIEKVGGYRDLNFLEDRDLYSRIAEIGRFRFLKSFQIVSYSIDPYNVSSLRKRLPQEVRRLYLQRREKFRIGEERGIRKYVFTLDTKAFKSAMGFLLLNILCTLGAFTTHWFYPRYRHSSINSFNLDDYIVENDKTVHDARLNH